MRQAYLVNLSQSTTSIPLFEKLPVTVNGRKLQKLQFKVLAPNQELILGNDISSEKKKYYLQFKPIMIMLKYRNLVGEQSGETSENNDDTKPDTQGVNIDNQEVTSANNTEGNDADNTANDADNTANDADNTADETANDANTESGDVDETTESKDTENKAEPKVYAEADLKKLRQSDLIDIAESLGLEATTQESKAEITAKILEKQSIG